MSLKGNEKVVHRAKGLDREEKSKRKQARPKTDGLTGKLEGGRNERMV